MAAFSTTDAAIITHEVQLDSAAQFATSAASGRSIYHNYDIIATAQRIVQGRFKHVALQFPDEALIDSVPVYWALKRETRAAHPDGIVDHQHLPTFYILADTSYGNCCVDEVAAQHVNADLVVHYGHACLSPTALLPALYVFPKQPVDTQHAATSLAHAAHTQFFDGNHDGQQSSTAPKPEALVLTYDVAWQHAADDIFERLQAELKEKRIEVPLVKTEIDTRRNFEHKLRTDLARSFDGLTIREQPCAGGGNVGPSSCCQSASNVDGQSKAGCCSSATTTDAAPTPPSTCCSGGSGGGGCAPSSSTSAAPPPPPASSQPSVEQQRHDSPLGPSRSLHLPAGIALSSCAFLYLGPESLSLTNLLLLLGPTTRLLSYNPHLSSTRLETGQTNRLLMKRYTHVLKARDASVVGLLVGTLGVHSYLPLLTRLRRLLTAQRSGRKVYTISVGKLNPAKLANFQEIDVFVLVACPENSLVDSKDFFRPIVTPYEMELAVDAKGDAVKWTGEYVLELDRLVSTRDEQGQEQDEPDEKTREDSDLSTSTTTSKKEEDEDEDEDRPLFSLLTGSYVSRRRYGINATASSPSSNAPCSSSRALLANAADDDDGRKTESHTVALRNADGTMTTVLQSASTAHMQHRGWKGLDQRLGLDQPSILEEGRQGIAKGYRDSDGTREGSRE